MGIVNSPSLQESDVIRTPIPAGGNKRKVSFMTPSSNDKEPSFSIVGSQPPRVPSNLDHSLPEFHLILLRVYTEYQDAD